MFKSPGAIAFSFFSIDVHWYGIVMALSILLGLIVVLCIRKKFYSDIKEDDVFDISFLLILSGVIFARLYYVLLDYKYFIYHSYQIPCIWNGGLSIHGAIIGCILTFFIYSKVKNLNFLKYADLFSFGLISGQIIGRWGNFFNSEAFGLPCSLPWKLYIPYKMRPLEFQDVEYFHPTFLYESLLNILILSVLYTILRKNPDCKRGTIFFSYIIMYSVARMLVESIRVDSILNVSFLHVAHIASLCFFIFGILGLIIINTKKS